MKQMLVKLATWYLNQCGYTVEPKAKPMDNVPAFIQEMRKAGVIK